MELPRPDYPFHNAIITAAQIGSRREVTLTLQMDIIGSHEQVVIVTMCFGGIDNFDEVKRYFGIIAAEGYRYGRIDSLTYAPDRTSKPGNMYLELRVDRPGGQITIHCRDLLIHAASGKCPQNVQNVQRIRA